MNKERKDWYEEWFDSPYYDLLYNKRDETEAVLFIDNLLTQLDLSPISTVLDLACGKGRHAVYLHKKGFQVTGMDLSKRSIEHAKQFENKGLEFVVQDMRLPLEDRKFSAILNLFTSFGYFDDVNDNLKVLASVKKMLLPNGTFVLDYLNGQKLRTRLVKEEEKTFPEATFIIKKRIENGFVMKEIELKTAGFTQHFQEKVRLFHLKDFKEILDETGLHIQQIFGNYQLDTFDADQSDRLILIAKNKS